MNLGKIVCLYLEAPFLTSNDMSFRQKLLEFYELQKKKDPGLGEAGASPKKHPYKPQPMALASHYFHYATKLFFSPTKTGHFEKIRLVISIASVWDRCE